MLSRFSPFRLCDLMDSSQPGSSVHGIFQARILKRVAISFSRHLPDPGIKPKSLMSPTLAGRFFTTRPLRKPQALSYFMFIVSFNYHSER